MSFSSELTTESAQEDGRYLRMMNINLFQYRSCHVGGGGMWGRAQDGSIRKCKRFPRLSKTVKHKCLRVCLYKGTV